MPDIRGGNAYVLGKSAVAVNAHADGVFAEMAPASEAIAAMAADQMPFAGDQIACLKMFDVAAHRRDCAHKLMADNHRWTNRLLRPGIPLIDVYIRPADGCSKDFDQNIIDARLRNGDFLQNQTRRGGLFDNSAHFIGSSV